ncbi:MAG: hypothetical protein ABFD07_03355, partial [Methanobacterium sp.]
TTDELSELGPLKYLSEVTNTSMDSVMKWFILLLIVIGDPMAIIMIVIFSKIINNNDAANDAVTEGINEGVTEGINEGINEGVTEENEDNVDEYFDELPIQSITSIKVKEDPKVENQNTRTIRIEDLPEKNNRGFSVNVPDNKRNNLVERIGSNKEIRDHDTSTVFFKKKNKK